jgi:Glycosyltransferase family 87
MCVLGVLLAMHGLLFWHGWHFAQKGYSDFTIFYTAGQIVRQGQGQHLYDNAMQYQIQQSFASAVQIRKGPLPYNHPAFEALLFVPLTYLNYATAYLVWDLINLSILAALPFLLRPHISLMKSGSPLLWLLVLLGFFPIVATLMQGQDAVLVLLIYVLTFVALKRNAEGLAGIWLGLGTFRFHLIVPLIVIFLCWQRWKTIRSFLTVTVILAGVSVAITGWQASLHYPAYVLHLESSLGHAAIFPAVMPNLRGLVTAPRWADAFPVVSTVALIALSLGLLVWVIAVVVVRGQKPLPYKLDLQFSVATVATVLVCYHAYAYDLSILIIPAFLIVSYMHERPGLEWRRGIALLLPIGLLFCTPLYILLGFRSDHLNLLAIVELVWLWAIRAEIVRADAVGASESQTYARPL